MNCSIKSFTKWLTNTGLKVPLDSSFAEIMSNKLTKGWECSSSQFNGLILLNMSSDLNYSVLCLDPKSPPVKLLNAGSRLKQWSLSKLMKITCKTLCFLFNSHFAEFFNRQPSSISSLQTLGLPNCTSFSNSVGPFFTNCQRNKMQHLANCTLLVSWCPFTRPAPGTASLMAEACCCSADS